MDIFDFNGEDFKVVFQNSGWKIGMIHYSERFSKLSVFERHTTTDEAFAVLSGSAVLYIKGSNGTVTEYPMEKEKIYVASANEWHHITVSPDAAVIVIENSDTSKENTEKVIVNDYC